MAHPKLFRDHHGIQYRQCGHCEGAGEFTARHHSGNPELETTYNCPDCNGEGDFRVTPVDLLERIGNMRRSALRGAAGHGMYRRLLHRQLDIRPRLPADRPCPPTNLHPVFVGIIDRLAKDGLLPSRAAA